MLYSTNDMTVLMSVTMLSLLAFYRVIQLLPETPGPRRRSPPQAVPDISWEGESSDDISSSFDTNGLSAFACSKTKGSANSDFFDISQSRSGLVSFYLGDVGGNGLSASLCQASCTSVLKLASAISLDPVGIVSEVNESLCRREAGERYAKLLYGTLDLTSGRLRLLSAGHPNPIRVSRDDRVEVLECTPCLPVGILPEHKYVITEHRLEPGDTLLLYSDGIVATRDGSQEALGDQGLARMAQELHSTLPGHMVENLFEQVCHFGSSRKDDQTLLALHYSGLRSEFATNKLLQAA
jgi:serine phosphatase RsbU (regulator of sigma subunit)